jgi:hypothetical protein
VEASFKVTEENGDRLHALFVGEVLEPFLANLVRGNAILPLFFWFNASSSSYGSVRKLRKSFDMDLL